MGGGTGHGGDDDRHFSDFVTMIAAQSSMPGPAAASSWGPSMDAAASMNAVIQSLRQFFADPAKVVSALYCHCTALSGVSPPDHLLCCFCLTLLFHLCASRRRLPILRLTYIETFLPCLSSD